MRDTAWAVKMMPQMENAQPSGVIGVGRSSLICTPGTCALARLGTKALTFYPCGDTDSVQKE